MSTNFNFDSGLLIFSVQLNSQVENISRRLGEKDSVKVPRCANSFPIHPCNDVAYLIAFIEPFQPRKVCWALSGDVNNDCATKFDTTLCLVDDLQTNV